MTLNKITDHLYSTKHDFPFGGDKWKTCAYLLCRNDGNLIVYSSSKFEHEERHLRELGGVTYQYLTHRDEATAHSDWITNTFDAPLVCHDKELEAISKKCIVGDTISQRTQIFADFEAIPTPGHTPGSTCYLWQAPDACYLFTGDTVFFYNNRWEIFMNMGTPKEMISSLELISGLDFDYLVAGAHTGDADMMATTPRETRARIDEIIDRVTNGKTAPFS